LVEMDSAAGGDESSNRRIEMLRIRLEQYNAAIAEAMGSMAAADASQQQQQAPAASGASSSAAAHINNRSPAGNKDVGGGGGVGAASKLFPPTGLHQYHHTSQPLRHMPAPPPAESVERSLINELLAAAAATGASRAERAASESRKSSSCEVTTEVTSSEEKTSSAVPSEAPGDGHRHRDFVDCQNDDNDGEVDDDEAHPEELSPQCAEAPPVGPPPQSAASVAELEVAYHAINAVEQSLKVVASFVSVAPQLSHAEKLASVSTTRENTLRNLAEATAHASSGKLLTSAYWGKERDVQTLARQIGDQCTESERHFSAVFEKKALIHGKEKQLEARAAEMQRLHALLMAKRQSIASKESGMEHRKHLVAKREEEYRSRREDHRRREERARQEIASVEKLTEKIGNWTRILEARDDELTAKEQRLRNVQVDLTHRAQEIYQLREKAQQRRK
jgi:hypothetical protein